MAFTGLHLTDFGASVQAKSPANKRIKLTRVVLGDGALGNGSMLARKQVISEKMSITIEDVRSFQNVASAIVHVTNKNLEVGFYFTEMAIYCLDPDTLEEGAYSYDNCREQGEYIGDKNSGNKTDFYMRMRTGFVDAGKFEFPAYPNPVYVLRDELDAALAGLNFGGAPVKDIPVDGDDLLLLDSADTKKTKRLSFTKFKEMLRGAFASIGSDGKILAAQLPAMDYIPTAKKGVAGGVAELDSSGKVPTGQLPSYVDDVLEYATLSAYPAVGEAGKIYVALDTNKTYRWSGSAYVEISASLALGETASTAYRGDRGKAAYDHSLATGNPHGTTAGDVGAFTKTQSLSAATAALLGFPSTVLPDEVFKELGDRSQKSLTRDLNIMLNLSLGTNNIDAWADLLNDTSKINASLSSGYTVEGGKLTLSYLSNKLRNNQIHFHYDGFSPQAGQTFTAINDNISSIVLSLSKTGTPSPGVYVDIYTLSGGLPNNFLGTSNLVSSSSISTSLSNITFTFATPITVTVGTQYALVVRGSGSLSTSNYYDMGFISYSSYAGGNALTCQNYNWGNQDYDCYFEIYSSGSSTVIWKAVPATEALSKMAIATEQTLGTGTITFYVSDNGTSWTQITALNVAQTVNFTSTYFYLKCVITGNASLSSVAWGGY